MELRHLRYFVAVAEEGSLTNAAERRLHTAQPSLSRQIRDLEVEVGVPLLERRARGIALTPAGRTFLDHARMALMQVEAASEAARRAAQPTRTAFVIGFLTGYELTWFPGALRILREEQPDFDVTLVSQSSPDLAAALMQNKIDIAFLRRETHAPGLAFKAVATEPLFVVMPKDHRLTKRLSVSPKDLERECFISPTRLAPMLKKVIDAYAEKAGIRLRADYDSDNLTSTMSLVVSTRGVTLLPLYVRHLLSADLTTRPLKGPAPEIELVAGYSRANASPLLKTFLARLDELIATVYPAKGREGANAGAAEPLDRTKRMRR